MKDTLTRYLTTWVRDQDTREALRNCLTPLVDRMSCQVLSSAGLALKAGGSTLAKTGATDCYAVVKGVLVKITSATDMPALVGTISANKYNVFCFFVDAAGTKTVSLGTEATDLDDVGFPAFPEGKTLIGFLLITHSSTFTGGTTALDTATTVYVSPLGAFEPTVKV